ncbi:hypothetical protein [Seonamhaeicola marinus]|uniref:Uncharacterized protein n=1 Tax=Seonamhaeicola marinus TaxID=1912246 RepID=A0A5D0HUK5_9FLAO|nr:hypothetical protein [Seonamhaeicola marinus]TYA75008.1 hypothetical protein FUA24_17050 [Seonamhaeicola marinus]
MKFIKALTLILLTVCFTNCTIKESIVFSEDGSGSYLLNYDMTEFMSKMKSEMGGGSSSSGDKVMDTTIVFKDIMEKFKDSVAALPEEKRLAMEAVKDMYMKMNMNEAAGVFDFGIGMNFKSIADLKDMGEKIKKVQSLNAQKDQVDAMKGSPLGKFMSPENNGFSYDYSETSFSRTTTLPADWDSSKFDLDENSESDKDKEFMEYFENASYIVEYTFPKKIKSYSIDNAELSNGDKTITYKVSWLDFVKNPKVLDVNLTFANE